MTQPNLAAAPISREEIRRLAIWMRDLMGVSTTLYLPITAILERLPLWFDSLGLTVEILPKSDMKRDTHAYFDPGLMTIAIREDVYDGACAGNGRDRMTIAHEISHFFLIRIFGVKLTRCFCMIKKYEDPEWQAKALAGEFMMPAELICGMTPTQISDACGVSKDAAIFQYGILQKTKGQLLYR